MMIKKVLLAIAAFCTTLAGGYGLSQLGAGTYMSVTTVMDGVTATTTGNFLFSQSYRNVVYSIDTSGSAVATIKFIGSIMEESPSSTASRSETNQFEYLQIVDLEDGTTIDGDTGITLSGTDDHRLVEINTNLINWVAPVLTSYTTGTIDMSAVAGDNR